MSLTIDTQPKQHCHELIVAGTALTEVDLAPLMNQVNELVENGQNKLIVNLENVKILNSLGINCLIKIFTKCRNNGGDLYIVNISDKINQVLLLTKLNTVLNIATSTAEAEDFFNLN